MKSTGPKWTPPPPIRDYPLGTEPTGSAHAVVCAFPRLADVHGYALRNPETMRAIGIGYPRFFRNPVLERLIRRYREVGLLSPDEFAYALHPAVDMDELVPPGTPHRFIRADERCALLALPRETPEDTRRRIEKRIRFQGCVLCSRCAAASLGEGAALPESTAETLLALANGMGVVPENLLYSNSGMSAFYAAFRAIRELQHARGRTRWLQLGWLYVDSGEILAGLADGGGGTLDIIWDVNDRAAIEAWLNAHGDELAGVVVEVPNNPLLQVVDLPWLAEKTQKRGGLLMVDPSTVSTLNVNVLQWCDLLVTSLTKYTGWTGELMLGLCGVNPASPQAEALLHHLRRYNLAASTEAVARLDALWPETMEQTRRMSASAARLADFLRDHPAVDAVWYPDRGVGAGIYAMLCSESPAKGGGGMVTFTLKGSLAGFYDGLACFKGPSFGTYFTNVSPFIHLAHYDLATTQAGRAKLARAGIPPDLIRASIGCEPYADIEAAFRAALEAS